MKRLIFFVLLFASPLLAQNYTSYNGLPVTRPIWLHSERVSHGNLFQDPSLVGWWPLDHDATMAVDSSGNGNNGTWYGTKTGTYGYYSAGVVGPRAGVFNGSDDYITPSSAKLDSLLYGKVMSVSAWIKVNNGASCTGGPLIISDDNGLSGTTARFFQFKLTCKAQYIQFNAVLAYATINGSVALNDGKWHFMSGAWNGATISLYVDGVSDATPVALTGSMPSSGTSALVIGAYATSSTLVGYFPGQLADIRVYNRNVSQAEFQAIYNRERSLFVQ